MKNCGGTNHTLDNVLASYVKMRKLNDSTCTISWVKIYLHLIFFLESNCHPLVGGFSAKYILKSKNKKQTKLQSKLELSEIYSPNIRIIYLSELQSWLVAYGWFWENEYEKTDI